MDRLKTPLLLNIVPIAPTPLVYDNPSDLLAIDGAVFIVNAIAADRETTWSEGVLLVGAYALFGLAFCLGRQTNVAVRPASAGCRRRA